jgi:uncharacterized membrane protein
MSETNTPPASRFVTWFSLAVFNTIALVGLNSELEQDLSDEPKEIKWCISAMIVVLCLSLLGVLAHMLRGKFIGTTMEGGLVSLPFNVSVASLRIEIVNDRILRTLLTLSSTTLVRFHRLFFVWACGLRSFLQ